MGYERSEGRADTTEPQTLIKPNQKQKKKKKTHPTFRLWTEKVHNLSSVLLDLSSCEDLYDC